MSIDDEFNNHESEAAAVPEKRPEDPEQPPRRTGRVRALLRKLLEQQAQEAGRALTRREQQDHLERYWKILRRPVRQRSPFCAHRVVEAHELYRDVSATRFAVSDEGGEYDWLGTDGCPHCGALVLFAYGTNSAPATACLGLCHPHMLIEENLDAMLDIFHESHTIIAVLVGRDTDLELAYGIAAYLQEHDIQLNADLGTHTGAAIHIASGEIVASPELPRPNPKMKALHVYPFFDIFQRPEPFHLMEMEYDDRTGMITALENDYAPDWQPE